MADLKQLLAQIPGLDARRDFHGLRALREQIVEHFPDADAAAEAMYKIGLDLLFRERKLDDAVHHFEAASRAKHPFWSASARTSLGLCYYHQQRTQKALFELRKVAYAKAANVHSVTALAFIENIFETEGDRVEAARVRKDRIAQLEQVIAHSRDTDGDVGERGYHLYQLASALGDQGEGERAQKVLQEARSLGPEGLGAELYRSVVAALNP